ncbi:MAG TPA: hypothetical protein VK753_00355 [Xanthomonadaceae bacterium]|nr:hypothetical protein [Xanthomonadaceae bacterium]
MRAFWLISAVLGLVFSTDAGAGGTMIRESNVGGSSMHHAVSGSGWARPGIGSWGIHDRGFRGDHGSYRRPRIRYVYVQPAYVEADYADDYDQPDLDQTAYDDSGYAPTEYVPAPAPMTNVAKAPPMPAPTVRYSTSADPPVKIPPGAKVTKGSVYKYTKDGVNTYTNVPPPDSARAKLLFAYTEVVSSAVRPLYRCVGGESGKVGYSDTPVPNLDCKAIDYPASSVN